MPAASHAWDRRWLTDIAGVVALRGVAMCVAAALGFSAISDDDFARTVIAQQFSHQPRLDPSGSSWLPFPFWVNGGAMWLFGAHYWVARGVAVCFSLASAAAVYVAARWFELDRRSAQLAAGAAALLPHAVWLGYAPVPEGFCAAAGLLAVASTTSTRSSVRLLGACLIAVATLSRYETWAVAAAVALLHAHDAFRHKRPLWGWIAALCCLGPALWLLHGAFAHGDALFFVARVADYRRLLGRSPADLADILFGYPGALLRAEPELMVLTALAVVARLRRSWTPGLRRPLLAAALLLGFLIWGDLRDGAPTHHPERPLLFVWLVLCLLAGACCTALLKDSKRSLLWIGAVALAVSTLRPWITRRDAFIDRSEELALGAEARRAVVSGRLLIDIGDYGYFAVIAGFEAPERAVGVADIDPRQAKLTFEQPAQRLRHYVALHGASWVVLRKSELGHYPELSPAAAETQHLALVEIPDGWSAP